MQKFVTNEETVPRNAMGDISFCMNILLWYLVGLTSVMNQILECIPRDPAIYFYNLASCGL